MIRRLLLFLFLVPTFVFLWVSPAGAHAGSGTTATNYHCVLHAVSPQVPGMSLRIIALGDRMELRNSSASEVIVLGYEQEPYLRVGSDGVFANLKSPAYYLNQSFDLSSKAPSSADPNAEPQWKKISGDNTISWHDHRIHWMGGLDPPAVRNDPRHAHDIIPNWTVQFRQGDTNIVASGTLRWEPSPSPSPWPWYGAVLGSGLVALVVGLRSRRAALGLIVAVLIIADMMHIAGLSLEPTVGSLRQRLGASVEAVIAGLIAWTSMIYGAARMWRRQDDGPWFILFAASLIAVVGGLADLATLRSSQLLSAFPRWVTRLAIALSIGMGCGLAAAMGIVIRRSTRAGSGSGAVEVEAAGVAGLSSETEN